MGYGAEDVELDTCEEGYHDLFPAGPAKQGVRVAGLAKPYGKGGY